MSDPAYVTVRRLRLGQELRRLREERKWTQGRAGRLVGRGTSSLAKVERGVQGLDEDELLDLLELYDVTDERHRDFLLALRRDASRKGWWSSECHHLPPSFADFISLEEDSVDLKSYEVICLPGLFQTESYIRLLLMTNIKPMTPQELDYWVGIRLRRQEILHRSRPPMVHVILNEFACLHDVGDRAVMAEQMSRLLEMSHLPCVTLQLLTRDQPVGLRGDSFDIMEVGQGTRLPLVIIENSAHRWFLQEEADLKEYGSDFAQMREQALSVDESRELLERMRAEWRIARG